MGETGTSSFGAGRSGSRRGKPAVWLGRTREGKDRAFAGPGEARLRAALERGLTPQKVSPGSAGSPDDGGGRARRGPGGGCGGRVTRRPFSGVVSLTFDLKLVDAVSGESAGGLPPHPRRRRRARGDGPLRTVVRRPGDAAWRRPAPGCRARERPMDPPSTWRPPWTAWRRCRRDGVLYEEAFQALQKKARALAAGRVVRPARGPPLRAPGPVPRR